MTYGHTYTYTYLGQFSGYIICSLLIDEVGLFLVDLCQLLHSPSGLLLTVYLLLKKLKLLLQISLSTIFVHFVV